jgi:taurine dioxygenase
MSTTTLAKNSTIEIKPLSSHVGAEIYGVDLRKPMAEQTYREVRAALNEHGVIFFRDQDITPQQHIDFADRFGGALVDDIGVGNYLDGYPKIYLITKEPEQTRNIGGNWHSDHSFDDIPPLGAVLAARELPDYGGDTMFASMYNAYDSLSEGLKKTLNGLRAVHRKTRAYDKLTSEREVGDAERANVAQKFNHREAVHAVTPIHPESGRRVLYVNPTYTVRFEGWTEKESEPLLQYLYQHSVKPENTCRFVWRDNSIAFWDNRSVCHYALNDYHGEKRLMHRVTVQGMAWAK